MKLNIEEVLCCDPPTNLTEHIKWLQATLAEIPEPSRSGAWVDIEAYQEYSSAYVDYTIRYRRPETDEEYDYRTQVEQNKRDLQREKELRLLEELRAKYEPEV